jgi:hypothetical protein
MTDKLALQGIDAMISTERPVGADEGTLGNENIGREDILTPRLALAQKTSPEIDPTQPRYIEGLQFTDLFHSITKQVYGKGPLHFVILRKDQPRYMEFIPLEQGGGVSDPNVPAGDPRTKFGPVNPETHKAEKPVATKFYDFIILLLNDLDLNDPMKNVMALSMKSSAIQAAKQLNLFIMQRGKKMLYKGVYSVSTGSKIDGTKSWAIYKVGNAGWLVPGSPVEQLAAEMFEIWKEKETVIDDSFDPETIEAGM